MTACRAKETPGDPKNTGRSDALKTLRGCCVSYNVNAARSIPKGLVMSDNDNTGRILRPRQFVPLPSFIVDGDDWLSLPDGDRRWVGRWGHPEIADLVRRAIVIAGSNKLNDRDWKSLARVEAVILYAERSWGWWMDQMDHERLLPDAPCRPAPEDVLGVMPTWDSFVELLGALQRCRSWIERVEVRIGIAKYPFIADVIAAAFDGQPEPI